MCVVKFNRQSINYLTNSLIFCTAYVRVLSPEFTIHLIFKSSQKFGTQVPVKILREYPTSKKWTDVERAR